MKNLFYLFLVILLTSFINKTDNKFVDNNKNTLINGTILKDSVIEIYVKKINYSRNINDKSYNSEIRKTNTNYHIDMINKVVNVTFYDDSSTVTFDSVDIIIKNNIYEVSYKDIDLMGVSTKIYSTIKIDLVNNKVDYIERNLDYENDYNLYKFLKFKIR